MSENAINADEIKQWLDSQSDFSLELKVFSHLLSLDFYAEHGGTYSDPVTNKPRQFDVRCRLKSKNKIVKLAVECKALSPQFPLVIQQVPRIKQESYHELFWAFEPPNNNFHVGGLLDPSKALRTRSISDLYSVDDFVGKSSSQIGRKKRGKNDSELYANDSEIYDKWSQAIASSHDLASSSSEDRETMGLEQSLTIIFPVLVVPNFCLWSVDYDALGNRISEPTNCDEIDFYIDKKLWKKSQFCATYTISHLKVATLKGFKQFAEKISSSPDYWRMMFPPTHQLVEH
ncbi:MAG: hypothetical protein AAGF83_21150 [Cyanobacteria bacterium P01_G01_bin.67]